AQADHPAGSAASLHGPGAHLRPDLHPDAGWSRLRYGNREPVYLPHRLPLLQFRIRGGDVLRRAGSDDDLRPRAAPRDPSGERAMKSGWRYALASVALLVALAPIYWLVTISLKKEIDQFAWPPLWWNFTPIFQHYRDAFLVRSFGRFLVNSSLVA